MIAVRDSKYSDIKELCSVIRPQDAEECRKLGHSPRFALLFSYKNAVYRKTALVNGQVAAMWGVCGNVLSETGFPFLVTGFPALEVSPVRFTRLYKKEVKQMNKLFPELTNYVDSAYTESVRLLKLTGFTVYEPSPSGFQKFELLKKV